MKKVLKYGVGWKFETLEALAKHFSVPIDPLRAQVKEYNGYVKAGEDKQFGKPMAKAKGKYLESPFVVVRNWPKVHYCQGGARVDIQARVLNAQNLEPIPGLFAAGEVTGGVHGLSRLGSCSIPDCMVMGMTAAESMMKGGA